MDVVEVGNACGTFKLIHVPVQVCELRTGRHLTVEEVVGPFECPFPWFIETWYRTIQPFVRKYAMCCSSMVLPSCPSRGSSGVKAYLWDGAHPLARRRFPALIDYRCGVACIMGGGAATAIGKHLGGVVFYWRPWFLSIGSDSSESSFPIPPPASLGALGNVWKILKGHSTTIPHRVIHVATDITFVGVRNGTFNYLCQCCYSPGYR